MKRLWALALAVLLSGCLVEQNSDGPEGTGQSSSPLGTGQPSPGPGTPVIDVEVEWRACDAGFCANATATNRGSSTVQVSSICESPWKDRMSHDGQPVSHREPQFMCFAYGRAPFAPGDEARANFTWDGRLHEDGGASRPAPDGTYTWSIAFWWDDDAGGARQEAVADVHLVIGAA